MLTTVLKYVGRRIADRLVDMVGWTIGIIALVLTYTAGAAAINVVVELPEVMLPTELVSLAWELGQKCLAQCFE